MLRCWQTRRCGAPWYGGVFLACCCLPAARLHAQAFAAVDLPDAPSAVLAVALLAADTPKTKLPPCPSAPAANAAEASSEGSAALGAASPALAPPDCVTENPLRTVVNSSTRQPLSVRQKGVLAAREVVDPFNLVAIAGQAAIGVARNSHSAYGPGFKGFGKLTGYAMVQDAQGEFFGTFLIPSLTHEDPRYRRMQNASAPRRILHALQRTLITNHDDGSPTLNLATLLTYPISAELSNLYVPGVHGNAPSTAKRIGIGLATDPIGNLIAEFLPDVARRIHVRSIFIQQIVNQMALGATGGGGGEAGGAP